MKGLTNIFTQMVKVRTLSTCLKPTLCPSRSSCTARHCVVSTGTMTNTSGTTAAGRPDIMKTRPHHLYKGQIQMPVSTYQFIPSRQIASTSVCLSRGGIGVGGGQQHSDEDAPRTQTKSQGATDLAWAIRLANENGYLSWCRNTYLASAVACGMQAEGTLEVSQLAAQGVFLLAGINLTWGTINFIIYILQLRQRMGMSLVASLINITGATFHLLVWLALVTMYLGLTEEPPETPDGEEV
ncbi:transmembrane protein 160-like isoform X2 [Haliotis rufescens]|nr:transmembrane protein 160-like isoform X2 [Haliotis rufescens]XP_048259208.1 transmembrane protein 160-like isoform X2 [Haliotis rufescens]